MDTEKTLNGAGESSPAPDGSAWLAGWYATKLHAVPDFASRTIDTLKAVCGAWVFRTPRTEWAAKNIQRGLTHCKHCERILSHNGGVQAPCAASCARSPGTKC